LNAVNGVQDLVINQVNVALNNGGNPLPVAETLSLLGGPNTQAIIPSPDWSKDLANPESSTRHAVSKVVGSTLLTALVPVPKSAPPVLSEALIAPAEEATAARSAVSSEEMRSAMAEANQIVGKTDDEILARELNRPGMNISLSADAEAELLLPRTEQEAVKKGLSKRDAGWPWRGLHETEAHHPLMQGKSFREFWRQRGFANAEVDNWTVNIDKDIHGAVSSAAPGRQPWWDEQLLTRIISEEAAQQGNPLSKQRIIDIAEELLQQVNGWSP
jgi:hypothetical protein